MPDEEVVLKHAPAVELNYTRRKFSIQFDQTARAADRQDVKEFLHSELDGFITELKKRAGAA